LKYDRDIIILSDFERFQHPFKGASGFYNVDISDNLVVKVTLNKDDAIVEGISGGKATIIFSDNLANKLEVDVNVKLPHPELKYDITGTILKLYWDQIANADLYELYFASADVNGNIDVTKYGNFNLGSNSSYLIDLVNLNKGDIYFVVLQAISLKSTDIASGIDISKVIKIIVP
jgi:hypothetical protein